MYFGASVMRMMSIIIIGGKDRTDTMSPKRDMSL